jgi:Ser/Thr protein kinase RdoA (MazF antagonist)
VFTRPVQVMENITRVTRHLTKKIHAGGGDASRETLTASDTTNPFFEAAAAFARFQRDMADLPPPRLHETIPGFGDTELRFGQFQEARQKGENGRAAECQAEIQFCLSRKQDTSVLPNLLKEGRIPERTTHYDTKMNNVLVDDETGKGSCVIDLDTVMPGLTIYDFGDCVRAATALAAEDETDLSKVGFSMATFQLLADG